MNPRGFSRAIGLSLGAVLAFAAAPALAQTYSPTVTAPDLGKVAAANSGTTTFTFSSSNGNVSQSGSATRISSSTVRGLVTIDCSGTSNVCASAETVKIGSTGTPTGKLGSLSNFTITASSGSISGQSGTNPVSFTITPVNKNTPAAFYFGADVPVYPNGGTGSPGNAASGFYVYVAKSPTVPTTGTSGNLTAVIDRPIAFSGTTAMEFGTIYNPTSGTSTVTLDPNAATNPVSVTGNAIPVASPTPQRATYNITGEGGQTFSVSLTALNLAKSGSPSIPVTLTTSTLPTALSSTAGNQGTATFYVGGHFDITPTTPGGTYTGSYNVTVQYN